MRHVLVVLLCEVPLEPHGDHLLELHRPLLQLDVGRACRRAVHTGGVRESARAQLQCVPRGHRIRDVPAEQKKANKKNPISSPHDRIASDARIMVTP